MPTFAMIFSLCPSQKIAVSINQADGRRHIVLWMTLIGLPSKAKRDATAHIPSAFDDSAV